MQTSHRSSVLSHAITCKFTGTAIGLLQISTVAGALPFLSHWKEMQAAHPLFSLPSGKLLAFARGEYERLAKASKDGEASTKEEELLCIAFVAVLHSLESIKQERPALPSIELVQLQFPRLFKLAYWKHYLDSKRFAFPSIKLNRINDNETFETIPAYLDTCFSVREDYERGVKEITERAKVEAAEAAMRKLRDSWIVPVGKKALWRWVRAHFQDTKYQADAEGWISTLFLGAQKTILEFDSDETDLMEEMILNVAPGGNSIMHAVRKHIDEIRKLQQENKEAFTVDFGEYTSPSFEPTPAPKQSDFPSKVHFIRAHAIWQLQQRAAEAPPEPKQLRIVRAIEESEF